MAAAGSWWRRVVIPPIGMGARGCGAAGRKDMTVHAVLCHRVHSPARATVAAMQVPASSRHATRERYLLPMSPLDVPLV